MNLFSRITPKELILDLPTFIQNSRLITTRLINQESSLLPSTDTLFKEFTFSYMAGVISKANRPVTETGRKCNANFNYSGVRLCYSSVLLFDALPLLSQLTFRHLLTIFLNDSIFTNSQGPNSFPFDSKHIWRYYPTDTRLSTLSKQESILMVQVSKHQIH